MALRPEDFDGAWLKAKRANHHIDELRKALASYSEGGSYAISVQSEWDHSNTVATLEPSKPIPDDLPLIVGDAVHNLRTALDHVASAARRDLMGDDAHAYFPFRRTGAEFATDTAALDAIEHAIPGARRIAIDEVQPYEKGKLGLYQLNALDKVDKHKKLILTTHLLFVNAVTIRTSAGFVLTINDCWLDPRSPTTLYRGAGEIAVECDFQSSLELRFGEGLPLSDEPVLPALVRLSDATSKTLRLLSELIA
jgi:hypothetical protein